VQLAAGDAHSAALTTSGQMFIWGSNHFGQMGLSKDGPGAVTDGGETDGTGRPSSRRRRCGAAGPGAPSAARQWSWLLHPPKPLVSACDALQTPASD
jgi:hypothetical protein